MKIQQLNDALLRGAMCATWLVAFILAFENTIIAVCADNAIPEQNRLVWHALGCIAVGVVAAVSHAYLIHIKLKEIGDK